MLTNKELLEFFITIIDTKLFEAVPLKDLKTIDIQHANDSVVLVLWGLIFIANFNGRVDSLDNEREQPFIYSL